MTLTIPDRHARTPGVHRWVMRRCVPLSLPVDGWVDMWVLFDCVACRRYVEYTGEVKDVHLALPSPA